MSTLIENTTAEIKGKRIKVLTYNIFLRPPFIQNNEDDFKNERLEEFLKVIDQYDIICFEEIVGFWNKRKDKLLEVAKKLGFLYSHTTIMPSLFSSFFIDGEGEFKAYNSAGFSDMLSQKGILYAKISVEGRIVHIFHSHTQASYEDEIMRQCVLIRSEQFNTFRNFTQSMLKKYRWNPEELCLLVGDFNVNARSPYCLTSRLINHPLQKVYSHLFKSEQFNEYEEMMCILGDNSHDEIIDHIFESFGHHPITYGDTYVENEKKLPKETVLTTKDDLCSEQCLDYIIQLVPKTLLTKKEELEVNSNFCFIAKDDLKSKLKIKVIEKSGKVEPFYVTHQKVTQLSDHYGVSVELEIVQ